MFLFTDESKQGVIKKEGESNSDYENGKSVIFKYLKQVLSSDMSV